LEYEKTKFTTTLHTYTKGILGTFIYKMNTLITLSTFIDKSNMGSKVITSLEISFIFFMEEEKMAVYRSSLVAK